jgi:hypothetical protein
MEAWMDYIKAMEVREYMKAMRGRKFKSGEVRSSYSTAGLLNK